MALGQGKQSTVKILRLLKNSAGRKEDGSRGRNDNIAYFVKRTKKSLFKRGERGPRAVHHGGSRGDPSKKENFPV